VDEEGVEWKKQDDIGGAFVHFYKGLFTVGESQGVNECLGSVDSRVTLEMNTGLLQIFTQAEVEKALFQMQPLKSLGPDGFSACFY
jgi:hypothetical protein